MAFVTIPTRTSSDPNSSADINQLMDNTTANQGGGDSFNTVDDADYTILDGDGYTDIVIENMSAIRTVTLPTIADNGDRRIRIWHGDLSGGTDYKLNVTSESASEIDNSSTGATTIPLMSPGDNIELRADTAMAKWVVKSAHSKYRKAFYTYSSSPSAWSDTNDGTYIKREGFDVFLDLNSGRSGNWSLSEFILTVDTEFRPPNTISKTADGNNGNKEAITLGLVSSGILFISGFINAGNNANSGLSWRVV